MFRYVRFIYGNACSKTLRTRTQTQKCLSITHMFLYVKSKRSVLQTVFSLYQSINSKTKYFLLLREKSLKQVCIFGGISTSKLCHFLLFVHMYVFLFADRQMNGLVNLANNNVTKKMYIELCVSLCSELHDVCTCFVNFKCIFVALFQCLLL